MRPVNKKIRKILKEAYIESDRLGCNQITPDHIVMTILNEKQNEVKEEEPQQKEETE